MIFLSVCLYGRLCGWIFIYLTTPSSWDEGYLIVLVDVFDVLVDSICKCFIEYFPINVLKRNWSEILFVEYLCCLGSKVTMAS